MQSTTHSVLYLLTTSTRSQAHQSAALPTLLHKMTVANTTYYRVHYSHTCIKTSSKLCMLIQQFNYNATRFCSIRVMTAVSYKTSL